MVGWRGYWPEMERKKKKNKVLIEAKRWDYEIRFLSVFEKSCTDSNLSKGLKYLSKSIHTEFGL